MVGCARTQYVAAPSLSKPITRVVEAKASVEKAAITNKELATKIISLKIAEEDRSVLQFLVVRQEQELRDANGNLLAAKEELETKQTEITSLAEQNQINHNNWQKAEVKVAKQGRAILKHWIIISGLSAAIIGYGVLHFGYGVLP
jgi:hypothetical protein